MTRQTLPRKGSRCLVGVMVLRAIEDMRKPCPGPRHERIKWVMRHRSAVLWLGSTQSGMWLELVGLEVTRCLKELRWSEYAADLLAAEPGMAGTERRFLEEGIRHMENLTGKAA